MKRATDCEESLLLENPSERDCSQSRSARAIHKSTGKKRGTGTNSTDRESEVNKIFIVSVRLIGWTGKETSLSLVGRTVKYDPQKLTNHTACTERYNITKLIASHFVCLWC